MNTNAKIILSYILGLAMGSSIGILATKKYFEEKANKRADCEIERVKELYFGKSINKSDEEVPENNTPSKVREALIRNYNTPALSEYHEKMMAENEHPVDSDEDDILEDLDEDLDENASNERSKEYSDYYEKNKMRPPKVISVKDLGDYPEEFEETEWMYYNVDDVMATEDGEVIDDYERFIGDCLDKFDFRNNGEENLFVVSFEYATIYEITKIFRAYNEVYSNMISEYGEEINKSWEEGN